MASLMGEQYPYASDWPAASFTGIESFAKHVRSVASLEGIAFVPLLRPNQVSEFEAFAQEFYRDDPDTAATAGITGCGCRVYYFDPNFPDCGDGTFPDNTGDTYQYDSPHRVLTPLLQVSSSRELPGSNLEMVNLHQIPEFGIPMDGTIDCVEDRKSTGGDVSACSYITDLFGFPWAFVRDDVTVTDSMSLLFAPIFPRFNATTLVGYTGGYVIWSDVLDNVVPSYVNEVDFVVESDTELFTYRIEHGKPRFIGEGSHHDEDFSAYRKSKNLISEGVASGGASQYTFSFYPRAAYRDQFLTDAPLLTCISAVSIIVLTSIIFILYYLAVKIGMCNEYACESYTYRLSTVILCCFSPLDFNVINRIKEETNGTRHQEAIRSIYIS